MIISRVNLFFLSIFLGATFYAAPLSAQQDPNAPQILAPRTLTPPSLQNPQDQSVTISGGINVQTLDQVSLEAVGTLNSDEALPIDMWKGSNRTIIESLLSGLSLSPGSGSLRNLQNRLLLSAATPPEGSEGPISLSNLRADKLFKMGEYDQTINLIENIPVAERDNGLATTLAQVYFLKGEFQKACSITAAQVQQNDSPHWLKSLALCRMLAGQGDQAMLSLSILRETNEIDPLYDLLMTALHDRETPTIEALPSSNALGLALIKPSKAVLSESILRDATPTLNQILIDAPSLNEEQKATAIVSLIEKGFAKEDALLNILNGFVFNETDKGNALDLANTLPPMQAQALLYQVASTPEQISVIKTEALGLALEKASENGFIKSSSKIYAPLIKAVNPSADLDWFAPYAIRSLLHIGDMEAARPWFLLMQNAALRGGKAQSDWIKIRPLAIFAGFDATKAQIGQSLGEWWNANIEQEDIAKKAAHLFMLIEGLGIEVPDDLWLRVHQAGPQGDLQSPQASLWFKMNRSALNGKLGETLTFLLLAYGDKKPDQYNPVFLRDSLFALRTVGLNSEARILALDLVLSEQF